MSIEYVKLSIRLGFQKSKTVSYIRKAFKKSSKELTTDLLKSFNFPNIFKSFLSDEIFIKKILNVAGDGRAISSK